jgi:hypothetical protein
MYHNVKTFIYISKEMKMKKTYKLKCKLRGCDRPYYTKKHQLCPTHLRRLMRNGDAGDAKIRDYEFKSKDKL